MDERRLQLKVALLALAALASVAALLALIGTFAPRGDQILHVSFAHSGGVPAGAAVKLGGVAVGRVRTVALLPARRDAQGEPLPVRMDFTVSREVLAALHADATVNVAMQGALGEPFLELGPGSVSAPLLAAGAELRGTDPPRLDLLLARVGDLVDAAHDLLGGPNRPDARALAHDLGSLARNADALLTENRPQIVETLSQVRDAARDLRVVAQQSRALLATGKVGALVDDAAAVASTLRTEVPPLARDARTLASSARNLGGDFTPEDGARLRASIARYEAASESLEKLASRADAILQQIQAGQGTVGAIYKDPKLYQDLKDLVSDLKKHPWKVLWKE